MESALEAIQRTRPRSHLGLFGCRFILLILSADSAGLLTFERSSAGDTSAFDISKPFPAKPTLGRLRPNHLRTGRALPEFFQVADLAFGLMAAIRASPGIQWHPLPAF